MHTPRRLRAFVDLTLQGGLSLRIVFYWVVCQLGFAMAIFCAWRLQAFSANANGVVTTPWQMIASGFVISGLLLPIALFDMIKFSNRFAGPLLRVRRRLNRLARGEEVRPLVFRKHDLLQDLSRDFNIVLERLNDSTSRCRHIQGSEESRPAVEVPASTPEYQPESATDDALVHAAE